MKKITSKILFRKAHLLLSFYSTRFGGTVSITQLLLGAPIISPLLKVTVESPN